ncbi:MAG: MFS transporter [Chloroflexi bacterium]|nr:MFS transporter [Chloroflexota bacterium]
MPIVMVYLASTLHLSIGQVGLVSAVYSICSSISQPLFGYWADRWGGRWFASGGLAWMSIFQGLIGFVPDYTTLLIVAPLAGFGSAAFHPQGASGASHASGDRKTAGMAIFLLGGNGGFAFGPLIAAGILGLLGLHGTAVMALFGLAIAPVLFALQGQTKHSHGGTAPARSGARIERNAAFTRWSIIALVLVMSLRAWVQSAVSFYAPLFFTSVAGFSVSLASQLSFVILLMLAIGSLAGGFAADRIGGRTVMIVSFLISAPVTFVMFSLHDERAFLVAPLLGFMAGAAWPPTIVLAQELFPKNAAVASGLALGFTFAMGGLGTGLTGYLAEPERLGLANSLLLLSATPILAAVCTLGLPSHKAVAKAATAAREANKGGAVLGEAAGR